jgi:hypothetical protein
MPFQTNLPFLHYSGRYWVYGAKRTVRRFIASNRIFAASNRIFLCPTGFFVSNRIFAANHTMSCRMVHGGNQTENKKIWFIIKME